MDKEEIIDLMESVWKEKVYIETAEYIITGNVYMPQIGKKSRLLTEVLNSRKQFIAVTECRLEFKLAPHREIEYHDFLQINLSTILMMRPANEN